jgi:hypothetical protein|tara:strand:+ start:9469 stop:9681 length:213 start_codon:yes stop_codon:yes gene_type:complete
MKAKYINGSLYPNAKMTVVNDDMANKNTQTNVSTAEVTIDGPRVVENLGAGPKGQRSKMQIKKVPFKGVF